jgi:hypothetical protein
MPAARRLPRNARAGDDDARRRAHVRARRHAVAPATGSSSPASSPRSRRSRTRAQLWPTPARSAARCSSSRASAGAPDRSDLSSYAPAWHSPSSTVARDALSHPRRLSGVADTLTRLPLRGLGPAERWRPSSARSTAARPGNAHDESRRGRRRGQCLRPRRVSGSARAIGCRASTCT